MDRKKKKIFLLILVFAAVIVAGSWFLLRPGKNETAKNKIQKDVKEETSLDAGTEQESENSPENPEQASEKTEDSDVNTVEQTEEDSGPAAQSSQTSSQKSQSAGSSKQNTTSHQHAWKEHTAQRWVSNIVTVVDQEERYEKYSLYRMYWYNTGTWEETRDPARFQAWERDREGGPLSPNSITMARRPEDCPLFLRYNELGQPQYQGDHSIISGLYDVIPAVTHEEDRGYYETYVDYYYCDCGAKK